MCHGWNVVPCTQRESPLGSNEASDCVCYDGYYAGANATNATNPAMCYPCPAGSWCQGGILHACPLHSVSAPLSTSYTNCTCPDGWYGGDPTNCTACTAVCPFGMPLASPCTQDADAVCFECPLDHWCDSQMRAHNCTVQCPAGFFSTGTCTPAADVQCNPCINPGFAWCDGSSSLRACSITCATAQQFIAETCVAAHDIVCLTCTPSHAFVDVSLHNASIPPAAFLDTLSTWQAVRATANLAAPQQYRYFLHDTPHAIATQAMLAALAERAFATSVTILASGPPPYTLHCTAQTDVH